MNKKVMALAVAGAFVMPAAAFAQASNVQIYGTLYMEYSYSHQGAKAPAALGGASSGDLVNIDLLQAPGSEIGIRGEEALGGGNSAWFQCASTADLRGQGIVTATNSGGFAGTQGFCGRNSAIGLKGSWGNVFAGNWDSASKVVAAARITSDTGIWGVGPLLYGSSATMNDSNVPSGFSRRQNNSMHYQSPNFNGLQLSGTVSAPSSAAANTTNTSAGKPRLMSIGAAYSNGPLGLYAGYERHTNFNPTSVASLGQNGSAIAATVPNANQSGTDSGFSIGATYQLGPVKAGLIYAQQDLDTGVQGAVPVGTDATVSAYNLAAEWAIVGPHVLRGGYTKVNNTKGNFCAAGQLGAAGTTCNIGNRVYNGGAGGTGATAWQMQYVYNASKRTELTAGYIRLQNDANARYSLGGLTAPQVGQNQDSFAISIKNTF